MHVVAVMITGKSADRQKLAHAAVVAFKQQTYADKTLLVVNDGVGHGTPSFAETYPGFSELGGVELVVPRGATLGELRNAALDWVAEQRPDALLLQWDDDDWSHETRMELQHDAWLAAYSGAAFPLLLSQQVRYSFTTGNAYVRRTKLGMHGTVIHPVTHHRYPATRKGEDTEFLRAFGMANVRAVVARPELYLRFEHGSNTWSHSHIMGSLPTTARRPWQLDHIAAVYLRHVLRTHYGVTCHG